MFAIARRIRAIDFARPSILLSQTSAIGDNYNLVAYGDQTRTLKKAMKGYT